MANVDATPLQCPLCGEGSALLFGRIYRCRSEGCGLGFLDPQPSPAELIELYEAFYYPRDDQPPTFVNSTSSKARQHFEALDRRVGLVGKRVLDYGCGLGGFMEVARDRGCDVVGVEFDQRARELASEKGFRVEPCIEALAPQTFDFVYMNDVIEHLVDPVRDLLAIKSALSDGGHMFVVTMNMKSLKARLLRERWDIVLNPTHLWFYDRTSLGRSLCAAGFPEWMDERFPVEFEHHSAPRRLLQKALVRWGLDSTLKVLARKS